MKRIGWIGCCGFAILAFFQQYVIYTMEQSYQQSVKFAEPIIVDRPNKKQPKSIKIWTKDNFDRLIDFGNCTF